MSECADMSNNTKTGKKVKLTLKKIDLVATWKYGINQDDCKICGKNLMMPVYESVKERGTLSADVTIGRCEHGFHTNCINNWLDEGNLSCPHCETMWKGSKNVGSAVYVYKSTETQ